MGCVIPADLKLRQDEDVIKYTETATDPDPTGRYRVRLDGRRA